jgi:hypothetical protein
MGVDAPTIGDAAMERTTTALFDEWDDGWDDAEIEEAIGIEFMGL